MAFAAPTRTAAARARAGSPAFVYFRSRSNTGPGVLCTVAATFTSIRRKEIGPKELDLREERRRDVTRPRLGPAPARPAEHRALIELAMTSQLSVVVRPVLKPPCITTSPF